MVAPYAVLHRNRNLQILFASQVVSVLGDWLYVIAVMIVTYDLTHSTSLVALLISVRLLPYALFLPLFGMLADRWNRKLVMILAETGRGLCMVGLLATSARGALPGAFTLVFVAAAFSSFFRPALSAALPVSVDSDDLPQANALMTQMDSLSFVLGPVLAGVLAVVGHAQLAFPITGVSAFCSALLLVLLHLPTAPEPRHVEEEGWAAEILTGFRFLFRQNRGVLAAYTFTMSGITLLDGAFWTLSLALATQAFHLGERGTGFLNASYGVGGLLGGLLVASLLQHTRVDRLFLSGCMASCMLAAALAFSPAGPMPFLLLATVGVADVVAQVTATTVTQNASPHEALGRVFAAFDVSLIGAMLVGSALVGPMLALLGPRQAMLVFALAGLGVLLVCLSRLRATDEALGVRIYLRRVPALAPLSLHVLDDLAGRLHEESFAPSDVIIHCGDIGDKLYLIKSGSVGVYACLEDREDRVSTLGSMDYFGEIALLEDRPRSATVRADGPVEVYSLNRADFQDLIRQSAELESAMRGTGAVRWAATQHRLLTRL